MPKSNETNNTCMAIPLSLPYFICDSCSTEQALSTQQAAQVAENTIQEADLPIHCGSTMRLTVLEKELDPQYLPDMTTITNTVNNTVKMYFQNKVGNVTLGEQFEATYKKLIDSNPPVSVSSIRELLHPAAEQTTTDEKDIQAIINAGEFMIDNFIRNALARQEAGTNPNTQSGPIMPMSQASHSVEFVCTVCGEIIEVNPELKNLILESDEEIDLPQHHNQAVQVRIIEHQMERPKKPQTPASSFGFFDTSNVEEMDINSVGIDIGSSTSHLIFSKLHLRREVGFLNMTGRYNITDRKILFESKIINTPLLDRTNIDLEKVVNFCKQEYEQAGISPEMIDTGAVIVTGETAKKENAAEIVARLSDEAGKFVSAVAGPNLESMLGAMGSGAATRSQQQANTILNIDIGGGTSNLAVVVNGQVVDTSCINVGGRLLGMDKDFRIWRIDEPTELVMEQLDLSYQIGDIIAESDVLKIVKFYAEVLIEVMQGPAITKLAKQLMMTSDIAFENYTIDEIMFSGGVAEMIYNEAASRDHNDIGHYLADYLKQHEFGIPIVEPTSKIRATVIGTGSYSMAISGSTIFYDKGISFPLTNIPALTIDAKKEDFSKDHVIKEISNAFAKYDLQEGEEIVALYFTDPIYARDMFVPDFVKAIEEALPTTITNKQLVILVFKTDVGGTIGRSLKKETAIQDNFICLDEVELQDGDWIDIGVPLGKGDVFPVTVKSLVFN